MGSRDGTVLSATRREPEAARASTRTLHPVTGKSKLQMRMVDLAAVLLLVFEVPSVFFSHYRTNSIRTSGALSVAVLAYFLVRCLVSKPWQAAAVAGVLGLGGAGLSLS